MHVKTSNDPETTETPAGVEPDKEAVEAAMELANSGSLAIRTGQGLRDLTDRQKAAFRAIVNFEPKDPQSWPHIEVFLEVCAARGLDPWAGEAYLIKRKGRNGQPDTYTIQTGINGYRRLAASSGRYHSAAKVFWTGNDDDDTWWQLTENEYGITVKRRVWVDAWIWPDRHPAAAIAYVKHYDDKGEVQISEATAHWGMFAPYTQQWEGSGNDRRRVVDPKTKRPVMELNGMWAKGAPHMLAKCFSGETRIQTDRGSLLLHNIVNNRLPVKVRSIDLETGEERWQPVVNWWRNAPTKDWVRIWSPNGSRGNRPIRPTPDHPIWTPDGWVKAGELREGDLIAVASPTLTAEQTQVIQGGLLGDGTLSGRKRPSTIPHYAESHSVKQEGYLRWKAAALANLGVTVNEVIQTDGAGGSHPTVRMRTATAAALYRFRQQTPAERLGNLEDLGVAVWLMDDGSIRLTGRNEGGAQRPCINVHCCGFGVGFADTAARFFRDRYGIAATVLRRAKNPYLAIGVEGTAVLLERLAPYLQYDPKANGKRWVADPVRTGVEKGYAFVPVLRVEHVTNKKSEARYDIEVQDTHTFIANGVVVSNCSEALVLRKAFPRQTSGIFVNEEMHQADEHATQVVSVARTEAFERARAQLDVHARTADTAHAPAQDDAQEPVDAEIVHDDDAHAPGPEPVPEPTEEEQRAWLADEIHHISVIIGKPQAELAASLEKRLRVPLEEAIPHATASVLSGVRAGVVDVLRQRGVDAAADAYAQVPPGVAAPVHVLFGGIDLWLMAAPHRYGLHEDGEQDACTVCGGFEDDPVHGADRDATSEDRP